MKRVYYNDSDPVVCAWARELIKAGLVPDGEVDERPIQEVDAADLAGFRQCHFFCGILGWPYALKLAGWPDDRPVWTGSCPCQPFSAAGKRKGQDDERHLWPDWFRLVRECRPPVIFGEQVASSEVVGTEPEAAFLVAVRRGDFARANKLAKRLAQSKAFHFHRRWLDGVRADLEGEGYAFGTAVLGAHSVGAPHIRQRLFWVADAERAEWGAVQTAGLDDQHGPDAGREEAAGGSELRGPTRGVADAQRFRDDANGRDAAMPSSDGSQDGVSGGGSRGLRITPGRLGDADSTAGQLDAGELPAAQAGGGGERLVDGAVPVGLADAGDGLGSFWSDCDLIPCRDGKARRVEPGIFPLADGLPGRVGLLRGAGNAIVPQVARVFIEAYLEARGGPVT